MLRIIGIIFLLTGCAGLGISMTGRLKEHLNALYQLRQMLLMMQNEMTYSKSPLPEACRKISERMGEPYQTHLYKIYEEMAKKSGNTFASVWKKYMACCMECLPVCAEDKRIILSFGECAGFIDGQMQAETIGEYIHKIDLAVKRQEADITNKSKVIMSLSIMGGLFLVIILL